MVLIPWLVPALLHEAKLRAGVKPPPKREVKHEKNSVETQLIYNIEFTSDRKCMSVIVKTFDDNGKEKYLLLSKGADSVVTPRCTKTPAEKLQ